MGLYPTIMLIKYCDNPSKCCAHANVFYNTNSRKSSQKKAQTQYL